jgi:predicted dehydrogenase
MGIHALDTARFLIGDPRPVSVYARIGTYYREFDVDDTGVVLVNWEGGACSYIESGWWQPHADGPEAATQLYGLQGFGQLFPTGLQLGKRTVDPGFPFPRPEHDLQNMYDDQVAYFVQCIRSGSTPIPGGAEGLVNMQIIAAAYQSARTGKVVGIHANPSSRKQTIQE